MPHWSWVIFLAGLPIWWALLAWAHDFITMPNRKKRLRKVMTARDWASTVELSRATGLNNGAVSSALWSMQGSGEVQSVWTASTSRGSTRIYRLKPGELQHGIHEDPAKPYRE